MVQMPNECVLGKQVWMTSLAPEEWGVIIFICPSLDGMYYGAVSRLSIHQLCVQKLKKYF